MTLLHDLPVLWTTTSHPQGRRRPDERASFQDRRYGTKQAPVPTVFDDACSSNHKHPRPFHPDDCCGYRCDSDFCRSHGYSPHVVAVVVGFPGGPPTNNQRRAQTSWSPEVGTTTTKKQKTWSFPSPRPHGCSGTYQIVRTKCGCRRRRMAASCRNGGVWRVFVVDCLCRRRCGCCCYGRRSTREILDLHERKVRQPPRILSCIETRASWLVGGHRRTPIVK